jgi:transcriptional regulator GlxA family with amidase domain
VPEVAVVPVMGNDAQIEAVLETMRESIDQAWTVAKLAREVGMSRTVFAERFKFATGYAPLAYLTRMRMERASDLLKDPQNRLSVVAVSVGYSSQGAFHRAFRRATGFAPGRYRRLLQVRFRVEPHVVAVLTTNTKVKVCHA